jgi:hypothetical protein
MSNDKMAREAQREESASMQMIGWMALLGVLLTGVLLLAYYEAQPAPQTVVMER